MNGSEPSDLLLVFQAECGVASDMRQAVVDRVARQAGETGADTETVERVTDDVQRMLEFGAETGSCPCDVEVWTSPRMFEVRLHWRNPVAQVHQEHIARADEIYVDAETELRTVLVYRLPE